MIEVHNVTLQRAGRAAPALEGVSFTLAPGERVAVLGGNGSGKTTLGRLLNGTLLPSQGRVLVDGHDTRDPASRVAVRRTVGLLFQDPDDQFVSTSVEREIAFGLENLRMPREAMHAAVRVALHDFGLEAHRTAPPHALSGGEKARLALACVWVMQPQVLVLDETDSLLDRRGRVQLASLLTALPPRTTLVRLTTDADTAAAHSRLLVLYEGKLVADGDPDMVFAGLPPEVVLRTGQPLVWRVSAALASHGALPAPTTSTARLAAALQNRVASCRAPELTTVPAVPRSPAAPEGFVLRARDVHFRYEDAALGFGFGTARRGEEAGAALRGVSVALDAGECMGFMGSAGAGKTTLLHLLTGVLRPQSGALEWSPGWNGMPSLVLQFPERQLFAPTVREDVAYGLRASGVRREEIASRVDAALEEVGLPPGEFALRVPFHLSGGEMRRVALAGALAQGRRALLLDEPTLGLDAEGRARLAAILDRVRARGVACALASHAADFVATSCEETIMLAAGQVAFAGRPAALWAEASTAARCGVGLPRPVALAAALAAAGVGPLPACTDEASLVAALLEHCGRPPA